MSALPYSNPSRWEDHNPQSSENLGEIVNFLGILSPDNKYFYPKKLVSFISATDLAERLGLSRTSIYSKQVPLKDSKLKKRIIQLVMASDLAYVLLGKDKEKTWRWLVTPNLVLFGETPFDVIMRDEGEAVIHWLMERSGLKPGSAF